MFKTRDGVLHETIDAANGHIVRTLENIIGPMIDEINRTLPPQQALCAAAKLAIIDGLVGSPEKAAKLKAILSKVIE